MQIAIEMPQRNYLYQHHISEEEPTTDDQEVVDRS